MALRIIRIIRAFGAFVFVAALAVTTLLLTGRCNNNRALRAMTSPPPFGSTPALSTMKQFAEGTWIGTFVPKSAYPPPNLLNPDSLRQSLILRGDGTCQYSDGTHEVDGTWFVLDDTVRLEAKTIDGRSVGQVGLETLTNNRDYANATSPRQSALENFQRLPPLGLSADNKQLIEVGDSNPTGTWQWVRAR